MEADKFYKEALKDNQEGVMIKNLKSEYKPGARVGHMLKLKPAENELDLIITGAEYGKGKRVHNQMQRSGGGTIKYRCTVCKTERESGSANIALPKKEG